MTRTKKWAFRLVSLGAVLGMGAATWSMFNHNASTIHIVFGALVTFWSSVTAAETWYETRDSNWRDVA